MIEYSICTSVVLDIFINRSTDQMNSDFGGVLSPIFRLEYGQSIQMQYICVSFLAKSQLRERGVCSTAVVGTAVPVQGGLTYGEKIYF